MDQQNKSVDARQVLDGYNCSTTGHSERADEKLYKCLIYCLIILIKFIIYYCLILIFLIIVSSSYFYFLLFR